MLISKRKPWGNFTLRYQLRPYQSAAIAALREKIGNGNRRLCLVAPTGCHEAGHPILLADGRIKPVEQIEIGDMLISPSGEMRTVLRLCEGRGAMYRITPVKGEPFVVNEDHVLCLRPTGGGEAVDVRLGDWLQWSKNRKHLHKLFRAPSVFASNDDLPIDPYIVGVLLGDGGLTQGSVGVSNNDAEVIGELKACAHSWGLGFRTSYRTPTSATHFLTAPKGKQNPLRAAAASIGLVGCGAGEKFIHQSYLSASAHSRMEILAGLLDTDGYLSRSGYDFVSKSKTLAKQLVFLCRSLGLAAYVKQCTKSCQTGFSGTYWRVSISGDCDQIPCRVARRKAPSRMQRKDHRVTGFSVEPVGHGDFYGFTLDGDHRYLDGYFVAHHNSGKTVCAAAVIDGAQAKRKRIVFLAHRKELIDQCSDKLDSIGVDHGIIKSGHPRKRPWCSVQVASIQTISRRSAKPAADIVIIDEAHRCLAKSYKDLIDNEYSNAVILGLTATPWRLDSRGLGAIFEDLVVVAQPSELIGQGYLINPRVFAPTTPDLQGVKTKGGDYDLSELAKLMDRSDLTGDVVRHWEELAKDRPTVVFACSVEHAHHLADRFCEHGHRAEALSGSTPNRERAAILNRFAKGETQIVCNVDVLTEGYDLPKLSCCILARPTQSSTKYLQMVGRIMRPDLSKQDAIVLDHAGCTYAHGFASDDREYSLNDTPKKKKRNQEDRCKVCPSCFGVAPVLARSCPNCGEHFTTVPRGFKVEKPGELAEIFPHLRPKCRLCGSASTRIIRGQSLGKFRYGAKCSSCGATSYHVDEGMAKNADKEDKRSEYARLMQIAQSKGYKPGWSAHKYKEVFGVWPRGMNAAAS